jgi:hypothetical protein
MTHRWKKLENAEITENCCFITESYEVIHGNSTEKNGVRIASFS